MPRKLIHTTQNEKKLEEFSEQVENIVYDAQIRFSNNIDDIANEDINRFQSLLHKELNSIIRNIHSQNIELLKSSFAKQFLNSETFDFLGRKGKSSLTQLLFNILQNISKG